MAPIVFVILLGGLVLCGAFLLAAALQPRRKKEMAAPAGCGHTNDPVARFCATCGAALPSAASPARDSQKEVS